MFSVNGIRHNGDRPGLFSSLVAATVLLFGEETFTSAKIFILSPDILNDADIFPMSMLYQIVTCACSGTYSDADCDSVYVMVRVTVSGRCKSLAINKSPLQRWHAARCAGRSFADLHFYAEVVEEITGPDVSLSTVSFLNSKNELGSSRVSLSAQVETLSCWLFVLQSDSMRKSSSWRAIGIQFLTRPVRRPSPHGMDIIMWSGSVLQKECCRLKYVRVNVYRSCLRSAACLSGAG